VVQCQRCGLVYVTPREDTRSLIINGPVKTNLPDWVLTSNDPSVVSECWEMPLIHAREKEWRALQRNADLALDHIEHYRLPPGRLLDYGCGGGFFLSAAAQRGWEPYGLEPLAGHAIYARARSGAKVVADTLRKDTFPSEFFDVVTAFQVFEHLPDPSGELAKLRRTLKQDGLLLIEVPNIETWTVRVMGSHHRHFVPDHLYFFSPRTLRALVVQQGFEPLVLYRPKRYMTLWHLVGWGGRLLGLQAGRLAEAIMRKIRIEDKVVSANLGDIIAVIACKRR